MRILGDLVFAGLGQLKNARIDNVNTDPGSPSVGQVWYNTVDSKYRGYDGTNVITFATGGSTAVLQTEIDLVETSVGLATDGSYVQPTASNYLNATTTVMGALGVLDTHIKTNADGIATNVTNIAANLTEINAIETGAGLNSDGTFTAPVGSNYLGGATSLKSGEVLLDTQIKANADAIAQNTLDIATKVAKAGDTMTGNLAFGGTHTVIGLPTPTAGTDAANKNYVDSLVSGLFWLPPVDQQAVDHTVVTQSAGLRVLDTTSGHIFTSDGTTWTDTGAPANGQAVFDKATETGYVYNGAWHQFTGLGQVTAGVGLAKTGNRMDILLGAGIAELPTNEVGVDCYVAGGLFLTVDGTTSAPANGASQLSLLLNGSTLNLSSSGLKVAAQGITGTELNASVSGDGLIGGGGSALAVGAGTGITVTADAVSLDLTYADGRYINVTGDTMTGSLTLAADPTTNLMAATKQYVDAVTTALGNSTFIYDSGVTSATSHVVTHGIGTKYCNVTVVDGNDKVIIPDSVTFDSTSQLTVTFSSAITCKVVVGSKYVA